MMCDNYNVAIIGGGPAGLSAGYALSEFGFEVTIYEIGKKLIKRNHSNINDLGFGIGGAGLFSDGKFSFFPSNSSVYFLNNFEHIKLAYLWFSKVLKSVGILSEPLPMKIEKFRNNDKNVTQKKYISHASTLDQRKMLIKQLEDKINGTVIFNCIINRIVKTNNGYEIRGRYQDNKKLIETYSAVVLATGRFGGQSIIENILSGPFELFEHRYEIGIRIESKASNSFFKRSFVEDPKLLWNVNDISFRTFCTCRNGEVLNIPFYNFSALSGRRDTKITKYSNFSILAQFRGHNLPKGKNIWNKTYLFLNRNKNVVIWEPINNFLGRTIKYNNKIDISKRPWYPIHDFKQGKIKSYLNYDLYKDFQIALNKFIYLFPDLLDEETVCFFPCIEGTGFYPICDNNLRIKNENIWCAGDVVGFFRGLTPAFLSGYYVGLEIDNALRKK